MTEAIRGGEQMAPPSGLRVGDADREATAAGLREHYAQGRLTLAEFQQRLDAAFAAKTDRDLAKITEDLGPATPEPAGPPSARVPYWQMPAFRPPVPRGISTMAVMIVVVVVAGLLMRFALAGLWFSVKPLLIVLVIMLLGRRILRR